MTIPAFAPVLNDFSLHSAPAVSYPVGRSRFRAGLIALAALAGLAAGLFWATQVDQVGWRQGLLLVVLVGGLILALRRWQEAPRGYLHWDGQNWTWTSAGVSVCGQLSVNLDVQACLVLTMHTETRSRIVLWPERRAHPLGWSALRRAVYCRQAQFGQMQPKGSAHWANIRP